MYNVEEVKKEVFSKFFNKLVTQSINLDIGVTKLKFG